MKTLRFALPVLSLLITLAVGCAEPGAGTSAASESEVASLALAPAELKLFDSPNHVPDPACDGFTDLRLLATGEAKLVNVLTGQCALVADFDGQPRSYALHLAEEHPCGIRVYEGARPSGPTQADVTTIRIVDAREVSCGDAPPDAKVIVVETSSDSAVSPSMRFSNP